LRPPNFRVRTEKSLYRFPRAAIGYSMPD
jgi:hypothetical protein